VDIIKELNPFSFEGFEKKFDQRVDRTKDVLTYFDTYIKQLNKADRSGTADSYECAVNSFKKFLESKGRKRLNFGDVTPDWLTEYEKWMLDEEKSSSTIGIYIRSLRTIINLGINDGALGREFYPFGKRKYQIPSSRNVKKALVILDIKAIVNYKTKTEAEARARDLWVFSYLCNGANVKDIARLQYKNIDATKITFIRAKTERTTKNNLKLIVVMLLPEIKQIIDKWGVKPAKPDTYVFGFLSKSDTAEEELAKVRQATKTINKYMKRIGKDLKIDTKLTTYTARHTFATVLKRSGATTEFISESLGHKDLRTTENYLDSFEDSVKESFQRQLLNFDSK
ncbi:MAG TPA: site-specific integrase, partial [Cyclobacteriaceae bacterium]|nr:site-specific integrase [Cyclobacteriaceae bacterium]